MVAINSCGRSLPADLQERNLIPIASVAASRNRSVSYFRDCIKARRNPAYRQRRRIPQATLDALPLEGWIKQGNEWVIPLGELRSQLN